MATMADESVRARVHAILGEQAMVPPEEVRDDRSLADLGIDSMGVVEAIFAIEEAFDVTVPFNANAPEQAAFDVSTVGSVVAAVERLVAREA